MRKSKISVIRKFHVEMVKTIFTCAIFSHWTSDRLRAELAQYYAIMQAKGAPRYVAAYVDAVTDMLHEDLARNHIVFGYQYNGRFYTTHDDMTELLELSRPTPKDAAKFPQSEHVALSQPRHVWKDAHHAVFY